jgi:pyruvate dehydrogenase E1 component beta subunit
VPKIDDFVLPIGKARVVKQGSDVTIVSYSFGVGMVLEAVEKLEADGISCEIIDLRTLRPLDIDTVVASVKKTNRLVTVENCWPYGSPGTEVAHQVVTQAFDYLDAPPGKVTGKDVPMPYANNLEKAALASVDDVIAAVKAVCYRS